MQGNTFTINLKHDNFSYKKLFLHELYTTRLIPGKKRKGRKKEKRKHTRHSEMWVAFSVDLIVGAHCNQREKTRNLYIKEIALSGGRRRKERMQILLGLLKSD